MSSTTIAISRDVYDRLQAVKHKLEKENHCDYSFGGTVSYLLEKEENKEWEQLPKKGKDGTAAT